MSTQIQRLPCLPSSMVALDSLLGTDESIGFDDFLNGERQSFLSPLVKECWTPTVYVEPLNKFCLTVSCWMVLCCKFLWKQYLIKWGQRQVIRNYWQSKLTQTCLWDWAGLKKIGILDRVFFFTLTGSWRTFYPWKVWCHLRTHISSCKQFN